MEIQHFYDKRTGTLTYVVYNKEAKVGVVIDPVTDFNPLSGKCWTESCERVAHFIDSLNLSIPFVLDTHAHADHLTGMPFFKSRYGARSVIGYHITQVQAFFQNLFNLGQNFPVDGSQFDILLDDGSTLEIGPFQIQAIHTPGHTPACATYYIEDALFVGDALFMPDSGTARCDFPNGSAAQLFESIQKLYALPDTTRVFICHDYQPGGRDLRFQSTIGEEKASNVMLNANTSKEAFVESRQQKDANLEVPRLMLAAIQVNIRAGHLPEPEENGIAYLKLPLNAL